MKVTLIRPRYFSVWESLACGSIASYLKRYYKGDLDLRFFDGFFDSDEEIISGSVDSHFVGFSCTSPQMKHALYLAEKIKEQNPRVTTVFGGHHPSSLPEETLELPNVDLVVQGEGESGMLAVLNLGKIEGLWRSRVIENLDTIPAPNRKLIRQERTLALTEKNDGERIASVSTSRACPFHCVFCTGDHDVFGYKVRRRSVWHVLDEIEHLVKEWHIDFLKFVDSELNSSLSWLQDFCKQKYLRRITTPFGCNIHAALIDKSTLELMKSANCREIWVGVESGSPRILREIQKGITVKMVENVFRWAKEAGIFRRAYFIVGSWNETYNDIQMTENLIDKIDPDYVGFTILCPYPMTQIYEEHKEKLHLDKIDWSTMDEYSNPIWFTPMFSNQELHEIQRRLVDKYKDKRVYRHRINT